MLAHIDTFIFDVDGVFTDGRVLLFPDMDPVRTFHTRDAFAVQHAVKQGLRIIITTGGRSDGVAQSFERLGVTEFHHSVHTKGSMLDALRERLGFTLENTAYMGDDMPDLPVLQRVGLPCCPADAAPEVLTASRFVSTRNGGEGCVRDLLEQALKVQGKWNVPEIHTW